MQALIAIIQCAAALFVLWYAICALNAMNPRTAHGLRMGVVLIAVGTFFTFVHVSFFGHRPELPEVLTLVGLALGTYYNRRTARCPCLFDKRMGPDHCPPAEGAS